MSGADTNVSVKGLITKVTAKEFRETAQTTDMQIIIGNKELGDYYPTSRDRVQYTEAGSTKEGRIVEVETARGDKPVLHTLLVRPQ
jgi:hypothetical protein